MRIELKEAIDESDKIRKEFQTTEARLNSAHNKELSSMREQVKAKQKGLEMPRLKVLCLWKLIPNRSDS